MDNKFLLIINWSNFSGFFKYGSAMLLTLKRFGAQSHIGYYNKICDFSLIKGSSEYLVSDMNCLLSHNLDKSLS